MGSARRTSTTAGTAASTTASTAASTTTGALRRIIGAVAAAALLFGLIPATVSATDRVSVLDDDDPTLVYDVADVERKYVLTMVDDPTRVVAESPWTTETSWTAPGALLEPGSEYDGYVLTDPSIGGGDDQFPRTDEDGTFDDTHLYRSPVVFETHIADGPIRVEANTSSLAANGLRARFWPHFAEERLEDEDEERAHLLADGTMPMASPQWGVAPTITDGDLRFWIVRSTPDGWGPQGPPEDPWEYVGGTFQMGFDGMVWAVIEYGRELGLNIGYAGCEAASWIGNKFFGTKPIDCKDALDRVPDLDFDVVVDFEFLDDGGHVLFNTTGTAVESAGEYIVGNATATEGGFVHDWSEEMVGNFPLLSSYSTKMLGYLEIDPDHPLVDEDGTVELTFGVQGPAGAQAYLHDVGATDVLPGQRVTLGGDEALASEPITASATAATWSIHPSEFALRNNETEAARDARLYRAGVGRYEAEINDLAEELGAEILGSPPMDEPDFGEPVRFDAGKAYPLTILAWSSFVPGTVGLYYETADGYEAVPLEWMTPAAPGTLGFNEPAIADDQLELLDGTIDYALAGDGSRLVELTDEGLSTAHVLPNMEIDRTDPITLEGARLGTLTYEDVDSQPGFPLFVGLDKRVAINGDGTMVVASADTLDDALTPDVVVAAIPNAGVPFDDEHAEVASLGAALADADADPFRVQDGTLASRHVATTAAGDHVAVSELWLRDPDFGNHRALPANTESRVMLFSIGPDGWTLTADLQPTHAVDLDGAVTATAVDAAHLWIAVEDSNAVLQLDASTGMALATIDTSMQPALLVTDGVDVVAIDDDGTMVVIDVATGDVVTATELGDVGAASDAALIGDELFVANGGDGAHAVPLLARFDVTTGELLGVIGPSAADHTDRGHAPDIVVDDMRNVWVSEPAGGALWRYDPVDASAEALHLSMPIAGLAFDGTDILVVGDDVQSYEIDDPPHGMVDQWYRADLAHRLDPESMQFGQPLFARSAVPFTSMEAFTTDPLSSTAYALLRIDDSASGMRLVVVDTSDTFGSLVDDSQWADTETMPLVTGRSIAYAVDLPTNESINSIDLADGRVWFANGSTMQARQPMVSSMDHGRAPVGVIPDAFGSSIDIAPSGDGVRIATTTNGGIAVYEFGDGTPHKSLAVRTFATTLLTHQSTLALTDDGELLFHSEPGDHSAPGRLHGYRDVGDHWHEDFSMIAPYDETTITAQPFGGKVDVNGRFLTVAGRSAPGEPAAVWLFRDPYGDWRSFRTWNPLDHPAGVLDDPPTGNLVNAAGGRLWSQPLALVGHRPAGLDGNGVYLFERDTEPLEAILRYTRFS